MKILDWNGHEMEVAHSRRGVLAACEHHRNLIQAASAVGEPLEIVQKLYESSIAWSFAPDELARARKSLGYYTDLQSLRSEDAITWSVFGTVARADEQTRIRWVSDLMEMAGLEAEKPLHCEIDLWRRTPHPHTRKPSGSENDFAIVTDTILILGECKWKGRIASDQGKHHDKDQIEMRVEFLQWYRKTISCLHGSSKQPDWKDGAVLAVTIEPDPRIITGNFDGIEVRATTWKQVCALESHPFADEVGRYYEWKLSHTNRQ